MKTCTDMCTIKTYFEIVQSYATVTPFIIDQKGLRLYSTNQQDECLFDLFMPASLFEEYVCNKNIMFSVNASLMHKLLKNHKKKHGSLTFQMSENDYADKKLCILNQITDDTIDSSKLQIAPSAVKVHDQIQVDYTINVPINFFQDAIKNTSTVDGQKLTFRVENGSLNISSENVNLLSREMTYDYEKNKQKTKNFTISFSNISLNKLQKLGAVQWIGGQLKLCFIDGGSLVIVAEFNNSSKDEDSISDSEEELLPSSSTKEMKNGRFTIILATDEVLDHKKDGEKSGSVEW